jgi:HPt (histidine-containing phosphotransfer) domain-containing protein
VKRVAAAVDCENVVTETELTFLRDDPEMAELFIAEALDHLGTIEATLLALDERPGDVTLLNDIFRPFHTIKGNAGALGITSVQERLHLKRILRLDRLRLRGPCGARDEFHLAATAQNLRKLAKLIPMPQPQAA